jgi:hypothetical protein
MEDCSEVTDMSSTTLFLALAIVGGLGYYYYMLVATTPFSGRRLWLMPVLVGFFALQNVPADLLTNGRALALTLLLAGTGVAVGVFQGFSISFFRSENGVLCQRGSWKAALVLLAAIPMRLALEYTLLGGIGFGQGAGSGLIFPYLATFFAVVVVRALTILARYPELAEVIVGEPRQGRLSRR